MVDTLEPIASPLRHLASSATKTAATISTLYAHDEHLSDHAHERDDMVRTLYAPQATWTDPLTTVEGVESIVANYRSLAAISSSAELLVLTAKFDKDGDGQQVLKFDAQANYAVRWTPFQIHIRQLSEVTFDKDHLITRHVDHWSVESILTAIPILGFLYACIFRPLVGIVISIVFAQSARAPPAAASPSKVPPLKIRELKDK